MKFTASLLLTPPSKGQKGWAGLELTSSWGGGHQTRGVKPGLFSVLKEHTDKSDSDILEIIGVFFLINFLYRFARMFFVIVFWFS